jgi:hypothetical protein
MAKPSRSATFMRAVVIGRSHTNAISRALEQRSVDQHGIEVYLLESPNRKSRSPTISIEEAKKIASSLPAGVPLFLAMLGTYHNVIGLLKAGPDYDFLLSPSDIPEPGHTWRIPHRTIAMAFAQHLEHAASVRDLKLATSSPTFILGTPPPKQSNDFLLEKFMRQKRQEYRGRSVAEVGIERPITRLKLWKIESDITCRWTELEGMRYLGSPTQSAEPSGFLRRDLYNDDATHANAIYGALVVEQILHILDTLKEQPINDPASVQIES